MAFMIYITLLLGLPFMAIGLTVWAYNKLTGNSENPVQW
jgi:hypothetical protein